MISIVWVLPSSSSHHFRAPCVLLGLELLKTRMWLLVCFCSSYGAVVLLRLLKGFLFNGDSHGSLKENLCAELDDTGFPVQDLGTEEEADGKKTSKIGRGKVNGGFSHPNAPKNLWIERKLFCASIILPGKKIRVIERLSDRCFSVDLKPFELAWLIVALREASLVNSGSFYKQNSFGSRSLVVNSEFNRAGEYLKLSCFFGGRNKRLLCFPAGKNRHGWNLLANFFAVVSNGGKVWVKKSIPSSLSPARGVSLQIREPSESFNVSSTDVVRGKGKFLPNLEVSDWTQGFLPELMKCGLQLCIGAPSSSGEADRRFAWKTFQTEIGSGVLVVEQFLSDESIGLENREDQIVRGRDAKCAGDGASGEPDGDGVAEEEVPVLGKEDNKGALQSDSVFFSSLGNLIPKDKISVFPVDVLSVFSADSLVGGSLPAGFDQSSPVDSRDHLSLSEHSGSGRVWAADIHITSGLIHQATTDTYDAFYLGDIMGFGDEIMGSSNERAEADQTCRISGGLASGNFAKSYQFEDKGMGSFLGNVHVRPGGSPDTRFLARYEDITLFDNEETLSFASPASDSSARVAEVTGVEEGVSGKGDFCVICGSPEPCGGIGGFVRW